MCAQLIMLLLFTWLQKHWLTSEVARVMARSMILKSKLKSISSERRNEKKEISNKRCVRTFLAHEGWRAKNKQKLFATHGQEVSSCVYVARSVSGSRAHSTWALSGGWYCSLFVTNIALLHLCSKTQRQRSNRGQRAGAGGDTRPEQRKKVMPSPRAMYHVPYALCHVVLRAMCPMPFASRGCLGANNPLSVRETHSRSLWISLI